MKWQLGRQRTAKEGGEGGRRGTGNWFWFLALGLINYAFCCIICSCSRIIHKKLMNGSFYTFPVQLSAKASAAAVANGPWPAQFDLIITKKKLRKTTRLSVSVFVRVYEKGRCEQCQSIGWPAAGLPA